MSVDRRIQAPKTGNPGRARRLVAGALALAAALLMAAWLPQAASPAGASPTLASTPPAATTTTTSPLRAPHRQWLNLAYATLSSGRSSTCTCPSSVRRAQGHLGW